MRYLRFAIYDLRLHCPIAAIRPFAQTGREVEGCGGGDIYDLRLHCSIAAIRAFAQLEWLRVEGGEIFAIGLFYCGYLGNSVMDKLNQ